MISPRVAVSQNTSWHHALRFTAGIVIREALMKTLYTFMTCWGLVSWNIFVECSSSVTNFKISQLNEYTYLGKYTLVNILHTSCKNSILNHKITSRLCIHDENTWEWSVVNCLQPGTYIKLVQHNWASMVSNCDHWQRRRTYILLWRLVSGS